MTTLTIKLKKKKPPIEDPFGREFLYFVEARGGVYEMGDTPEDAIMKAVRKLKEAGTL